MTHLVKKSRLFPDFPSLVSGFFDEDRWFSHPESTDWKTRIPAANIKETEKEFCIDLAVPGMSKKDFHVNLENGSLTISAEKKDESEELGESFTRREFSYHSFSRSFVLPEIVDEKKISATYKDGVLTIVLPKKKEAVVRSTKEIKIT